MIGYLRGKFIKLSDSEVLLMTATGVGYNVRYAYPFAKADELELFIFHHITENDQRLWGFPSLNERKMFEKLITVNKVGPAKAYPMITTLGVDGVLTAIRSEDTKRLSSAPGIGKKMAEQIILTLKDKLDYDSISGQVELNVDMIDSKESFTSPFENQVMTDAIAALEELGLKEREFLPIIYNSNLPKHAQAQDLIKVVLREL